MKKGLSQEALKLIACISMLIDHIGYEIIYRLYLNAAAAHGFETMGQAMPEPVRRIYLLYWLCRIIGRLALPIFVFLLVEGIHHTRDRKKYALRLAVGALLSEIPYNLIVSGELLWREQSIMLTLLLGFGAVVAMEKCRNMAWKPVAMVPFAVLSELLMADYGWAGVALIALFDLSRYMYRRDLIRFCGMIVLFHYMSGTVFQLGGFSLPMQVLGALSMLFIVNYDGRKVTRSKTVQWAFYLFYPVHLLVLWLIGGMISAGYSL